MGQKQTFRIIPELRDLLPFCDDTEFALLKQSIKNEGLREPLSVWRRKGKVDILCDGHHRVKCLQQLKIKQYKIKPLFFNNIREVKLWIIENQLGRRSLSTLQKILIALEYEDYFKERAEKNKGFRTDLRTKMDPGAEFQNIDTLTELSKLCQSGRSIIAMAKYIIKNSPANLKKKAITGEVSISNAYFRTQDLVRQNRRDKAAKIKCDFKNPKGDYRNKIICMDVLEGLKKLQENYRNKIGLVVTSPPYNNSTDYGQGKEKDNLPYDEYVAWLTTVISECTKLLRVGGRIVFNVSNMANVQDDSTRTHPLNSDLIQSVKSIKQLKYCDSLIWFKYNGAGKKMGFGSYNSPSSPLWRSNHEYLLIWSKGQYVLPNINNVESDITQEDFMKYTFTTWGVHPITQPKYLDHPCTFPEKLISPILTLLSWQTDFVLDPFLGSGTTASCCVKNNRSFIGIDSNAYYYTTNDTVNSFNK